MTWLDIVWSTNATICAVVFLGTWEFFRLVARSYAENVLSETEGPPFSPDSFNITNVEKGDCFGIFLAGKKMIVQITETREDLGVIRVWISHIDTERHGMQGWIREIQPRNSRIQLCPTALKARLAIQQKWFGAENHAYA